jgi:cobyrinic acid a,c-diamide synthase
LTIQRVDAPRLVVAGTASGVGKTTVTLALARAFRARGLRVATFTCGPDSLDPTYHSRAAGAVCQNLDGWMMGQTAVRTTFASGAAGADVSLVEGVMGLFDGASPTSDAGSTAEIAKWLEAPTVLVVDASGMARSLSAVARGFAEFDRDLGLAGVVANRVGSRGHLELLHKAVTSPGVMGGLPRDPEHSFPDRHLGLRTADERVLPDPLMDHWGSLAAEWLDVDRLLALARSAPPLTLTGDPEAPSERTPCRVGVARDEAFHFYYADNLRRLRDLGATLVEFSPLRDTSLPDVHGLYLGGGYPEVHAAALGANTAMRRSIRAFAESGGPVYAECGGLMYLTRAIRTSNGGAHEMVGLFDAEARMCKTLQALGYAEVETTAASILGPAGTRFRGHQFRYSELCEMGELPEQVYTIRGRRGRTTALEGYRTQNVLASYVHAHWASNPQVPRAFVDSCVSFRNGGMRR